MRKLLTSAGKLLPSLALLLLAGCGQGTSTPLPATTKLLDELPRVSNSAKSPCWQQEEIAAQNSYVESIKQKKEVVYRAPCKVDQPKVAEARR